jgi:hypothetical protein
MEKIQIRDKHPGSATLVPVYYLFLLHVGNIYTNYSAGDLDGVSNPAWRSLYNRIWDVTDIIVPPVENNAFFITTNIVITPNQARGECAEREAVAPCRTDTDCPAGRAASNLGSGINTGVCNATTGSCQVYAWCPLGETLISSVLRIRDVYPGSRILIFTHPGSRIQKQQQKRWVKKKFVSNLFM